MKNPEKKVYLNKHNRVILDLIKINNSYILDIGCGAGNNASILKERGHVIDGVSISEEEIHLAKKYLNKSIIFNLELGLPILDSTYDYIICSHVIEHIAYPDKLLNDIKNIMNEKTNLIIALPNIMHYKSRFNLMLGNFNYTEVGILDYTHLRWFTFSSAKKYFIESGFTIESAFVSGDIPFLSFFKFIHFNIRKIIFKSLTLISKGFFGGQLVFVLKKI